MSPSPPRVAKNKSKLATWATQLSDRLARSSRVFLIGLIVACGVEVIVDWNATLYEINVLRDGMRQRGLNYVSILTQAAVEPMLAYDADAMDSLSAGLFDDEDVAYVRFSDHLGMTIYDRLRSDFGDGFVQSRKRSFRDNYAAQMDRDIFGILSDPKELRDKIAKSGSRDFVQAYNDLVARVTAWFVAPKIPPSRTRGVVLYQDRLRDERKRHDPDVTYALGTIVDERNDSWGVVVVGFSMNRTNAAIRTKLFKGLGMVLFFVGLILVQNIISRRDKLKLLDLESRHATAKKAIRDALPTPAKLEGWSVGAAIEQSPTSVDGVAWDFATWSDQLELLILDPDGDGIDAAATALHILRTYRERRQQAISCTIDEEAIALGAAALIIPLTRPIGIVLLRICKSTGKVDGIVSASHPPSTIADGAIRALTATPMGKSVYGLIEPLYRVSGTIAEGGSLVALCGGGKEASARSTSEPLVCQYIQRTRGEIADTFELTADAATWARGKLASLATRDLAVAVVQREPNKS